MQHIGQLSVNKSTKSWLIYQSTLDGIVGDGGYSNYVSPHLFANSWLIATATILTSYNNIICQHINPWATDI